MARHIVIHVAGESDFGLKRPGPDDTVAETTVTRSRRLDEARQALTGSGDQADAFFAGTPVQSLAHRLRDRRQTVDAGVESDAVPDVEDTRVVILATRDTASPTPTDIAEARFTESMAEIVRCYLERHVADVSVEFLTAPTMAEAQTWTEAFLRRWPDPSEVAWELPLGGGASNIAFGVVFTFLLAGVPFTLFAQRDGARIIDFTAEAKPDGLRRWLVRHRFYDVLATIDPQWEPLARRQAVDVAWLLTEHTGRQPDDLRWTLDEGARQVLVDAVQASFAEGLARAEITDGAAARTWLRETASAHAPAGRRRDVLDMLAVPRNGTAAARRPIDSELAARVGEPLASLLHPEVVAWHDDVKPLSHGNVATVPRPPASIRAIQDDWIRREHQYGPLAEYPAWPVSEPPANERRVLLLRAADTKQAKNDADVRTVLDKLNTPNVVLVEFTTDQAHPTSPLAGIVQAVTVPVEEADIHRRPDQASKYRERLRETLAGLPGAEMVDEVAVVVPAGAKALVAAAMLGAVDFSLRAAATLRIVTPIADHDGRGPGATQHVDEDHDRPLASLGLDDHLAHLAAQAVRNLDLSVAARLLRRGSARLHPLADEVDRLRNDAFGVVDPPGGKRGQKDRTSGAEVRLAIARLRLCATITEGHPWDAAYLASSVLDHTFRMPADGTVRCEVDGLGFAVHLGKAGWFIDQTAPAAPLKPSEHRYLAPWQEVRTRPYEGRRTLNGWRNHHPLSHGLEPKTDAQGRPKPLVIAAPTVAQIVAEVATREALLRSELVHAYPTLMANPPDPDVLVDRHTTLLHRIEAAGQARAASAANESEAAASTGTTALTGPPAARSLRASTATSTAASK